mmetsp:Transcript_176650/g.566436  ORF Transcript_176650/g.566436 Transcript_176650/m.566436 type:complete len:203 (-) Transcript_176650:235-843(-)
MEAAGLAGEASSSFPPSRGCPGGGLMVGGAASAARPLALPSFGCSIVSSPLSAPPTLPALLPPPLATLVAAPVALEAAMAAAMAVTTTATEAALALLELLVPRMGLLPASTAPPPPLLGAVAALLVGPAPAVLATAPPQPEPGPPSTRPGGKTILGTALRRGGTTCPRSRGTPDEFSGGIFRASECGGCVGKFARPASVKAP